MGNTPNNSELIEFNFDRSTFDYMGLTIEQLSRCTGFPPGTLLDFADRGLMPKARTPDSTITFNGFVLLERLEEVNHV
jgi:hypothetical protein